MRDRIRALIELFSKAFSLLRDERNRAASVLITGAAAGILKKLAPKKGGGFLRFGTGDPYDTGRAMEIAAFLYPLYGESIEVIPVFDKAELRSELDIKGHFRLADICLPLLRLYRSRDVRYFIGELRDKDIL